MEYPLPAGPMVGAVTRVDRAGQLIGTLRRQSQRWADSHLELVDIKQRPDGSFEWGMRFPDGQPLARMSVTMGEIVYNLRSALDYTVYVLASAGAGKEVAGTQFPIEDTEDRFLARVTGKTRTGKDTAQYLRGVPKKAVDLIAELQPYAGCIWTKDLRDFSNPDKHRHLTGIRSTFDASQFRGEISRFDPETQQGDIIVRFHGEVEVFLADGRPIVETLQTLHREVKATVHMFKSRLHLRHL